MKVFVVFQDFGPYDGGSQIVGIYKTRSGAEKSQENELKRQHHHTYPTYRIDEYEVEK